MFFVADTHRPHNLLKIDIDDELKPEEARELLHDYFDADYVVENIRLHAFSQMTDPRRGEQWALDMVNSDMAWGMSPGLSSVVVAVIDTGMDLSHVEFGNNLWTNTEEIAGNGKDDDNNGYVDDINGWDFHGNDANPHDETGARNPGHGTHCAGIIGAACGNNEGICGISPIVSLMALRFLGKDGSGDLFASTKAIDYAADNGAHIISASWGAAVPKASAQPIIDAINRAEEKGVIFVAAAGNDGKSNDSYNVFPANSETTNMITVAASDSNDAKPYWSNYGRKVDIAAPGAEILSTIPGGYQNLSGTSMATPMVSGIVALMKSVDLSLTGAQARSILQSTGADVAIDTESNKRVDAHEALLAVTEQRLTLVPAAATVAPEGTHNFSAWGGTPPYEFRSLNEDIATIDEAGTLSAIKEGKVVIEVTDSAGNQAQSVSIEISVGSDPGDSACPLPNEMLCLIGCVIKPDLPWCKDLPLPELPLPLEEELEEFMAAID